MKFVRALMLMAAVSGIGAAGVKCDRNPPDSLKGQSNTSMVFYAKAVDQNGEPLSGATFNYRIETYPKDWSYQTRDRALDVSIESAISDKDGLIRLEVTGCKLIRRDSQLIGYQHFFDQNFGDSRAVDNSFYRLISWGDLCYKSDPDHPAVYVFVKDGVKEVSALPCRGGYDSGNGTHWTLNKPAWPKKPSLPDVVYRAPTTSTSATTRR